MRAHVGTLLPTVGCLHDIDDCISISAVNGHGVALTDARLVRYHDCVTGRARDISAATNSRIGIVGGTACRADAAVVGTGFRALRAADVSTAVQAGAVVATDSGHVTANAHVRCPHPFVVVLTAGAASLFGLDLCNSAET